MACYARPFLFILECLSSEGGGRRAYAPSGMLANALIARYSITNIATRSCTPVIKATLITADE